MATTDNLRQKLPSARIGSQFARPRWPVLPLLLFGLVGSWLVYYATAWGPWAFSDAAGYISAARNLVAGHGIGTFRPTGEFSPTTSHPPLYVLTLGLVSQLGFEPLQAARITDVSLFGVFVFASGFMILRLLRSHWHGMAFSALVLVHPALIIAYTSAMAESPFILLGFTSLLLLVEYLLRHRPVVLLASSMCAAGAFLSRYPGATFVLTGALAILCWESQTRAVRLRHAAAFVALGSLPAGLFILWATSLPGAEGPRAIAGQVEVFAGLLQFGRSVGTATWNWKPIPPAVLLPEPLQELDMPAILAAAVLSAGLMGLAWFGYTAMRRVAANGQLRPDAQAAKQLLRVLGLFVAVFLAFFAVAFLVTNPTPDVDSRTLLPLLPALLCILVTIDRLGQIAWRKSRILGFGRLVLLIAILAGYVVISQDTVRGLHRTGLGYTSRDWRASQTIEAIGELSSTTPLITNEPYAVLLLTGRVSYSIYEIAQRAPLQEFTRFGSGTSEAERVFRDGHAVLVLFDTIHEQLVSMYGDRASDRYAKLVEGLHVGTNRSDGSFFWIAAPGQASP